MRIAFVLAALGLLVGQDALAQSQTRTKKVGPWNIAAFKEKGEFKHCIMVRPESGSAVGFGVIRGRTYLALGLFSKKWKLDKGLAYPVTLVADQRTLDVQAKADGADAVIIDVTGHEAFVEALGQSRNLQIRTPAATLTIPLDRSGQALEGLNACVGEETGVASNPFAGPQQQAQAANPFAAPQQQPPPAQRANPFEAPAAAMRSVPAPAPVPTPTPVAPAQPSAADQAYARARADCEQDEDADRQIAGCTTVAQSGRETPQIQGIALANRGFGYRKKGDDARALASFTEAMRLNPTYPNAHWGRGDFNSDRSDWPAAIRDYSSALRIDPKDEYSLFRRATAYLSSGDLNAALRDVQEANRIRPEGETYALEGTIHLARNDMAAAGKAFDEALKLSPGLKDAVEGKKKVEAESAQSNPNRAAAAMAVVSAAAKRCEFAPNLMQIAALAGSSGLDPASLGAEPYARIQKAEEERVDRGLRTNKDGFCQTVWAEYGPQGTKAPGLLSR
jgi:tetratricopeptide (TPR) repeat protein